MRVIASLIVTGFGIAILFAIAHSASQPSTVTTNCNDSMTSCTTTGSGY
jgi:hypothetical protein